MYKLDLPVDAREAAARELRQRREEERKGRIFDAKQRTMGLDLEALQSQMEEKKNREQAERDRNKAFELEALRQAKILEMLEQRQKEDMRALLKQQEEFRATSQRPDQRREFDLNDPSVLATTKPLRHSEDDEQRLGPSSLQKFAGEDPNYEARMDAQREQRRLWLEQQAEIKRRQKAEDDAEKKLHELRALELAGKANEVLTAEANARKDLLKATTDYNKAVAEEARQKKQKEKEEELARNISEIQTTIQSDLMSENPAVAVPAVNNTSVRILHDRYKGMSTQQRTDYLKFQEQQRIEEVARKEEEKRQREEYAKSAAAMARTVTLMERQSDKQRKQQLRDQVVENQRLAEEQKARTQTMRQTARQQADDSFFDQFNKHSR